MQEKFIDEKGNVVLSYSSSHPMLRLIPPDTIEVVEAVPITADEFKEIQEAQADKPAK